MSSLRALLLTTAVTAAITLSSSAPAFAGAAASARGSAIQQPPRPTSSWSGQFAPKHVTGREGSIGVGPLRAFVGKKVGFNYTENGRRSEASSRSFGIAWVRKNGPGEAPKAYGAVSTSWKASSTGHTQRDNAAASGHTTLRGGGYTHTLKEYAGPAYGEHAKSREPATKPANQIRYDGTPVRTTFRSAGAVVHQEVRRYGHANVDENGKATSGHIVSTSRATTTFANGKTSRLEGKTTWDGKMLHHTGVVDGVRYSLSGKPGEPPKSNL